MSTTSRIGILNTDGSIESISCHCDGYINHVGKLLFLYYNNESIIRKMLDLGDMHCLKKKLDPDPNFTHSFEDPQKDVSVFNHRDRSIETEWEAIRSESKEDYLDLCEQYYLDYLYLYDVLTECWLVSDYDDRSSFRKLLIVRECPFCGCEGQLIKYKRLRGVHCSNPDCIVSDIDPYFSSYAEAIENWNRRINVE